LQAELCRSLKGTERQIALDNVVTYWEGMPKADSILNLLEIDIAPVITDYLDLFDGPIVVDIESDRVWPVPKMPSPSISVT
jgi:hypothetical protein